MKKLLVICVSLIFVMVLMVFISRMLGIVSPKNGLKLSSSEVQILKSRWDNGDTIAALKLADYYMFYKSDFDNGLLWEQRAAIGGNRIALGRIGGRIKQMQIDDYRKITRSTNEAEEKKLLEILHRNFPDEDINFKQRPQSEN